MKVKKMVKKKTGKMKTKVKGKKLSKMKPWLKGGLIGISILLILIIIMKISFFQCPNDEFIMGAEENCSFIYNIIYYFISFVGLSIFFGGTLNLSSFGIIGIYKFYIISFMVFFLWGVLIGWIYGRFKK